MTEHTFQKGDTVTDSIRLMEVMDCAANGIFCQWHEGPNETKREGCFAPERLRKVVIGRPRD